MGLPVPPQKNDSSVSSVSQSVIIMEDLQRAADIDSQLAAGSIINQALACFQRYDGTPLMASSLSSFCERINSCANIVVTKANSLLSDEEIDKVVTL